MILTSPDPSPVLGNRIRDRITGIEGIWVAHTEWFDRSDEVAILREGLNADGEPFAVHWFPLSRLEVA